MILSRVKALNYDGGIIISMHDKSKYCVKSVNAPSLVWSIWMSEIISLRSMCWIEEWPIFAHSVGKISEQNSQGHRLVLLGISNKLVSVMSDWKHYMFLLLWVKFRLQGWTLFSYLCFETTSKWKSKYEW